MGVFAMTSLRCNVCDNGSDDGNPKDVVDVRKLVNDVVRKTVRETLRDFGVVSKDDPESSKKESDRSRKILRIVDDVVKRHLKCASPSLRGIHRQVMNLLWIVARRLEREGIPITLEDRSIILKRIWSHFKKAEICSLTRKRYKGGYSKRDTITTVAKKSRMIVEGNSKLVGHVIMILSIGLLYWLSSEIWRLTMIAFAFAITVLAYCGGEYGIIKRVVCHIWGFKRIKRGGYRGKYRIVSPILIFALVVGFWTVMILLGISFKEIIMISIYYIEEVIGSNLLFWVFGYFLIIICYLLLYLKLEKRSI
jgi:hypothetical protein